MPDSPTPTPSPVARALAAARAQAPVVRERLDTLGTRAQQWRRRFPVAFWSGLVAAGMVAAVVTLLGATVAYDYTRAEVPPVGEAAIQPPTVVVDASGERLAKLDPGTIGQQVSTADLPDHVVQAVLAAEDRDFHGHGGIDLSSTVRAALANLRSGTVQEGASTITQQYVDLTTEGAGRTVQDKLSEAAVAMRIDDELTKEQILDRYLNIVPFGRDAVGLDAAARLYFRVPAGELDVNQAATLAGMIAAPSAFDPEKNPEGAQRRRDVVLSAMKELGWIEPAQAERLLDSPLPEVAAEPLVQYDDAAYVVDVVRRTLQEELDVDPNRGLVVRTTIDKRMQQLAQEAVRAHVGDQEHTAALVSVDPELGAVRALVGGSDFAAQNFNAAIQARRQPGSAFKPMTLAALVEAGYAPDASRFEAPAELDVPSGNETVQVANFGGRGYGEMTVRDATQNSVNTVYMQMVDVVGPEKVVDLAHRLGVRSELPPFPSIALGTGAVTPYEMASAYATLAAGGIHRTPRVVAKVETTGGDVLYEAPVETTRAVPEQVAGVVTDILADVVAGGTGTAAQLGAYPAAGKTGTTNDGRDAWFAGYTTQLATVVWVGRPDNAPMGDVTGGALAAPLWQSFMSQAMEPLEPAPLPVAGQEGLKPLDRTAPDPAPAPAPPPSNDGGGDGGGGGGGNANDASDEPKKKKPKDRGRKADPRGKAKGKS